MPEHFGYAALLVVRRLLAHVRRESAPFESASWASLENNTSRESALIRMPADIILTICDHLDQEHRILLSLTCKGLRATLTSNLDLSIHDKPTKIRLLHQLELDQPQYLTCRSCALMFKWRAQKHANYQCPNTHDWVGIQSRPITLIHSKLRRRRILVNCEIVDLISRARLYGPEYGLSPSVLNSKGKGLGDIRRTNEARWVGGRLLIAVHVAMLVNSGTELLDVLAVVDRSICPHPVRLIVSREVSSNELEHHLVSRCPYCRTDESLHFQLLGDGRIRFTLRAWQDCGSRDALTRCDELRHAAPTVGRARNFLRKLQSRNLQAQFEADDN